MRLLKKYPNRRLYDTTDSQFVTLEDVKQLVLKHDEFRVEDSKTGKDLTSAVLLQIISEMEDSGKEALLTNKLLQQLIRFYGSGMQGLLSQYLEHSLAAFLDQQDGLQRQMRQLLDASPMNMLKKISEQNINFMTAFTAAGNQKKESD
ncbi:MAG: polyhydroxyalkanoate synthesis repressor PhaR [Pseudomonadales bacterium]|nr:polyhydroxyalkanoate synthesis repressor PhaR [Pseudomonadales bacterium]MCP5215841.1 polyhydroxyalkanoate synthesis repressor PhaR [Pseudomonadales bacterium]